MSGLIPILAALLPAVVLYLYIKNQDEAQPEPTKLLLKGVWYGILSALLAIFIELPLDAIITALFGSIPLVGGFAKAFFVAAIPEEACKLLFLWLLLRKNPYFDEHFDGIVYAVCVGLGFAGFENIFYVVGDPDWLHVALTRSIFAVPGHFFFAVIMGYFYSVSRFKLSPKVKPYMVLLAPVVAHGLYDGFLMSRDDNWALLSLILTVAFLYFFSKMGKYGQAKIRELKGR